MAKKTNRRLTKPLSAFASAILRQKEIPTHQIGDHTYKGQQPQYEAVRTLDPQTGLETVFYLRTSKGIPFINMTKRGLA